MPEREKLTDTFYTGTEDYQTVFERHQETFEFYYTSSGRIEAFKVRIKNKEELHQKMANKDGNIRALGLFTPMTDDIIEGIEKIKTLTTLDIGYNYFTDQALEKIIDAVAKAPNITSFIMSRNQGAPSTDANFHGFSGGNAVAKHIGKLLKTNTTLKEVTLAGMNMTDEGALELIEGAKHNTSLTSITLEFGVTNLLSNDTIQKLHELRLHNKNLKTKAAPLKTIIKYNPYLNDEIAKVVDSDNLSEIKAKITKENINTPNDIGRTPIFYAKSLEVAKYLVSLGAKLNIQDDYGFNILHAAAAKENSTDILGLFLHSAPKEIINQNNIYEQSAIWLATNLNTAKALLASGAIMDDVVPTFPISPALSEYLGTIKPLYAESHHRAHDLISSVKEPSDQQLKACVEHFKGLSSTEPTKLLQELVLLGADLNRSNPFLDKLTKALFEAKKSIGSQDSYLQGRYEQAHKYIYVIKHLNQYIESFTTPSKKPGGGFIFLSAPDMQQFVIEKLNFDLSIGKLSTETLKKFVSVTKGYVFEEFSQKLQELVAKWSPNDAAELSTQSDSYFATEDNNNYDAKSEIDDDIQISGGANVESHD